MTSACALLRATVCGERVSPTDAENVKATYRSGIGLAGLLGPGKLTLLQQRPLGVQGVTNPVAASGAADPENRDDARRNVAAHRADPGSRRLAPRLRGL